MRLALRTNRTCDYSLHVAATETDIATAVTATAAGGAAAAM
jgi:hypothetical protein